MQSHGYFKGWYFKCCSDEQAIAFIPAYHRHQNQTTASLQIITDSDAFHIPFSGLTYHENPLFSKLGGCIFSEKGIVLSLPDHTPQLHGALRFQDLSPIRYPIMGPFAYVPFMQCRHSVFSMAHRVDGEVTIGDRLFRFHAGTGYIEGDSGRSFPKQYIWTQCCFEQGSLMLSVADIPFCGFRFTGIIGVIMLNGREYRIATYLGARLQKADDRTVTVAQGRYTLTASLLQKNDRPLRAPENGSMCRTIRESVACTAYYRFMEGQKTLCEFTSDKAGFEFEANGSAWQ